MEDARFDALTKALATPTSRRLAIRRILGTLTGVSLTLWLPGHALADNSDCTHFCDSVFGPGPDRGQCVSDAAQGTGICFTCGPASSGGTQPICCPRNASDFCSNYSSTTCCGKTSTCLNDTCCPNDSVCGSTCLETPCDTSNCLKCDPTSSTCISTCVSGQHCQGGTCVSDCSTEMCGGVCCSANQPDCCGNTCTNTQTDPNNCGSCATSCRADQICSGGKCACPAGSQECNGTCCNTSNHKCSNGTCVSCHTLGGFCLNNSDCCSGACAYDYNNQTFVCVTSCGGPGAPYTSVNGCCAVNGKISCDSSTDTCLT